MESVTILLNLHWLVDVYSVTNGDEVPLSPGAHTADKPSLIYRDLLLKRKQLAQGQIP